MTVSPFTRKRSRSRAVRKIRSGRGKWLLNRQHLTEDFLKGYLSAVEEEEEETLRNAMVIKLD